MAYFNKMVKPASAVNTERQAAKVLEALLQDIPQLNLTRIDRESASNKFDIFIEGHFGGKPVMMAIEVKSTGQPRVMREAAHQLKHLLKQTKDRSNFYPVVMAPYLSEHAREACRDEGVGYADFLGNAHLAFDSVYIDRQVAGRPDPERRSLRSFFKPKSARILRCLFRDPATTWRVSELAAAAQVSIGLASTLGSALRERGWMAATEKGLFLAEPDELLDAWAEAYTPPSGEEFRFYTHLHGDLLLEKLRHLAPEQGRIALASFSAADWLAPYVRQATTQFYASEPGLIALERELDLRPARQGANVIVRVPDEDGVLADVVPVTDGVFATSPVQTYLDLTFSGERGCEGAEHLRNTLMRWSS